MGLYIFVASSEIVVSAGGIRMIVNLVPEQRETIRTRMVNKNSVEDQPRRS